MIQNRSTLTSVSELYSFRHGNGTMRTLALRTFIGSLGTLISSVINLVVLCALNGEPGWMCLTFCSTDSKFYNPESSPTPLSC
jgi:hypothetical protein